jgi:tetratricopeptide (TPR) repeat protein
MSQKYPNLLIPDDLRAAEVEQNLLKMDELCSEYARDEERQKDILEALHSLYWQIFAALIPSFITEETKEEYAIPAEYNTFLNYGIISEKVSPDFLRLIQPHAPSDEQEKAMYAEYRIIHLADWMQTLHERTIKKKEKLRLEARLKKAHDDLIGYPARLQEAFSKRNAFREAYPLAAEVVKISEEIDARLPEYNEIKDKIELSQRISAEERTRYVKLTEQISTLRDYRAREQQAISDKVPQPLMMRLDREVESIIVLKGLLEKELVNAENAVKEDHAWRKEMTAAKCKEVMKEEIRRTRLLVELAARRSHVKPLSIFIGDQPVPQVKDIVDAIEEILEVDPNLLGRGPDSRGRFPSILIVPIFGDGIYDFEKNMLLIPTRSPKGLTQAVATALIEYHLETEAGNVFKQSYIELRKNEGIYSSIKLRERMLRDYIDWVTREANGYQVMDQKTKQWFIENVAPSMFSLKYPRRVGDFPIAEGHELIKKYETRPDEEKTDFVEEFRVGIAYWRLGQYDKAHSVFVRIFNMRPDSQDACYNVALSSFKTRQKQKAIEYWRAYLKLDKMSFWTVRVQKFLNTVK